MHWTDTALYHAIIAEMMRHDRPGGHGASVMPRGGLIGVLVVIVSCLAILRAMPPEASFYDPVAWTIAVPPLLLLLWARWAAKPVIAARQLHLNEETSRREAAPGTFLFYLRPFKEDGRRPVTTRAASGSVAVLFGFEMDFELMLSQALRWTLPVVALGTSTHSKGAGRRLVGDEDWQAAFAELAGACAAIICIPGISASSLWELQQIRRNPALLRKTAFFMPPRVGLRLQRFVPEIMGGRTRRRWSAVRRECETFGLHLPPYRSDGCMFLVSEDGRAERELSLWGFEPARIETLCFAAVACPLLGADASRAGLAALAAKRPLSQRILASLLSRHAIPAGIWLPVLWGAWATLVGVITTGASP